jgi:alpha-tubulin suppressor-like RCC1 family protein
LKYIGKLGHGDTNVHRLIPTVVESLIGIELCRVVSMSAYSLALDINGKVYVWGTGGPTALTSMNAANHNSSTIQGLHMFKSDLQPQLLEIIPAKYNVTDISCGLGHALFLLSSGVVMAWGNGGNGRLGLGDTLDRMEVTMVTGLLSNEKIKTVQCGASHSLALTIDGKIYSWGKNTQGQCGIGNNEDQLYPQRVNKLEHKFIIQLAAGWEHSLALTEDGKMYSWGCGYKDNRRGVVPPVLGLGGNEGRLSPELISSLEGVEIIQIACGWDHCLALSKDGKVLSWGSGQNGKLGTGSEENISIPCYVPGLGGELSSDDSKNKTSTSSADKESTSQSKDDKVVFVCAGCEHTAVITAAGDLFSWGHGDGGRLGHGNNAQCFNPTKVEALSLMKLT